MRRRSILKGIGASGLLAAGAASPGLAAVTDGPGGGQLYLRFDDDAREDVAVEPADVEFGAETVRVQLDDEVFDVPPGCQDCCDACDCYGCLCYWCPPDEGIEQ